MVAQCNVGCLLGMTGPVSINKNGDRKMDLSLYRYTTNMGDRFIEAARYDSVHNNFTSYAEVSIESSL